MDPLLSRRSIRRYTKEPLSEDDLKYILTAGMSAPSAGNERPWHFIVVRERQRLDEMSRLQPHAQMLLEAPAAILVCGDLSLQKFEGFWPQDCSAAMENMLLAACSRRLGAVWLGIYPAMERVSAWRQFMGLPENIVPFSLMSLGHPGESKPVLDRYDGGRVRQERW